MRGGFTMIELLLATVLMSVLMIGVLAVITRVAAPLEDKTDPGMPNDDRAAQACVALLRSDLCTARSIASDADEVRLVNFGGLDPQTLEPTQLPVRVRYYTKVLAGRTWLLREQYDMVDNERQTVQTELVMPGIARIELSAPEQRADPSDLDEALPAEARWRLKVWSERAGRDAELWIDQDLILPRSAAR